MGHILSGDGISADPKKISAIRDMPAPRNKEDLQRFLSMIMYLGKFLPNLATETALHFNFYWKKELNGLLTNLSNNLLKN